MPAGNPGPVIPKRYLDALGARDPFESQREAPARVAAILRGLPESAVTRRPAPGKWSIRDVVAHLADGEVVFGARMRFVGGHDRPPLPGYDQDAFVERLGVENARTEDLLRSFAFARAVNLELLARLPEDAFDRTGLHAERGEESIRSMVVMLAGHDLVHEEQLRKLRAALGYPPGTVPRRRGDALRKAPVPARALARERAERTGGATRRSGPAKTRRRTGR